MKKFRSSVVLLLALMVFITSSGMAVNLHYCAGELQNVSLNQENDDCGMLQSQTATETCEAHPNQTSIKKTDTCCQNKHIVAKTDNKISPKKAKEPSALVNTFNFINHYFTSLFNYNSDDEQKEDEKDTDISLFPLLKQGLYILLQQFRN